MVLWKFSFREIRNRPGRAILTLISIVIGVAAVVSVSMAIRTARAAYAEMFATVSGHAVLEVIGEGGATIDQELVDRLDAVQGVKAAAPVVNVPTILYLEGDDRIKLNAVGVDPVKDRFVRSYEISAGQLFDGPNSVVLEEGFARNIRRQVGDTVTLYSGNRTRDFRVAGLLKMTGAAGFRQAGLIMMPLESAQRYFGRARRLDLVQIVAHDTSLEAVEALQARIEPLLEPGTGLRRPADRSQSADETLLSSELGFRAAAMLSIIVSAFIILNTFLINVGERRRQLAIMRAIGATRKQLMRMLLTEGLAMGALGTVLGIGVGAIGAYYLTQVIGRLYRVDLPALEFTLAPFLYAPLFGMGVSLLGSLWPAYKASTLTPLEGMGAVSKEDKDPPRRLLTLAGVAVMLVSSLMLLGSLMRWWHDITTPAAAGMLVGLVMCVPAALGPLVGCAMRVLGPLLGIEGRLAQGQIVRRRTRTSLTVGVLFVAISTGSGMASTVLDNIHNVRHWFQQTMAGDYFVRAAMPDQTSERVPNVPAEFAERLSEVRGIESMDTIRYMNVQADGQQAVLITRDFSTTPDSLNLDLTTGTVAQTRERLFAGEVALATVLAQRTGLKQGDQITLQTKEGPQPFRVAAIANEYVFGGMVVYMETNAARKFFEIQGVDAYLIRAVPGQAEAVGEQLQVLTDEYRLLLQSNVEVEQIVEGIMGGVVASLWVILTLGFVVAAFGIVNTLTMNVLEQTRELGLLRIVAMTQRQVRRMILSQAAIMGVVGLTPGLAGGFLVAWFINVSMSSSLGRPIAFQMHPVMAGLTFLGGYLVILMAAWLPARRATHLDPMVAIKVE